MASLKAREAQNNEVGGDAMSSMTAQVEQLRRERDQARKTAAEAQRELANAGHASRSRDLGESRESRGRESEDMRQLRVELASAQREQRRTQERLDRTLREGGGGRGGDTAELRKLQCSPGRLA